jgi:hypothetical protein
MTEQRRPAVTALQIRDDPRDGHHQAQIARRRLPTCNQQRAVFVNAHFVGVHVPVGSNDLLHLLDVAGTEGVDRRQNLSFDQPSHLQDAGADAFKLEIELFTEVIIHEAAFGIVNRTR